MNKELLQRYIEGDVAPDEVRTVVEWLDDSVENVREYMALHKLYDISVLHKTCRSMPSATQPWPKVRRALLECAKIAALFLLALVGVRYWPKAPSVPPPAVYHTLYVPSGQHAELMLSDGTKVWLNAQSKLIYPAVFGADRREISLDGEGYFEVTHNAQQPFVVKTKTIDIQVLGTEFDVVAYASRPTTEVALLKGSVALKPVDSDNICRMQANEYARWENGRFFISTISNYDYFKWKEGLICFDDAPVELIISKLELYFDIKINVERQRLLTYRYTGKFRTKDGVEQVLRVLQLEHKFTYTRDIERNLITIK